MNDDVKVPAYPGRWITARINELCEEISTNNKKIKTKDALAEGIFPVSDQGMRPITG